MEEFITLTNESLGQEPICCAMADKKSLEGVHAKKAWLSQRMQEGLKFIKLNVRGKVFIEYLPAENAWVPIEADGYTYVDCHWVSGSFKGHGYGKKLLELCENDVRNTNGVVLLVGKKKKSYLPDKSFYIKQGYEVCDACEPDFELIVKRFNPNASLPRFKKSVKQGMGDGIKGVDIFYTAQCPFTIPYIGFLKPVIMQSDIPVWTHQITTREAAQEHFAPVTTYSVFVNGQFYSNEILTVAKLEKLLDMLK